MDDCYGSEEEKEQSEWYQSGIPKKKNLINIQLKLVGIKHNFQWHQGKLDEKEDQRTATKK